MVAIKTFFAALSVVSAVHAAPIVKRIAQVIDQSTVKWEAACDAAGGGLQCNAVAVAAFENLLAAAGPCDQQNAADSMVDLAHTLPVSAAQAQMITFAQLFAQQPRNSPNSVSVPYCQQAPKNKELDGLFQCQFDGVSATTFVGGIAVGAPGTVPFGHSVPLSPPRSCPAHTSGGIADGTQLTDITSDPGVGSSGGSLGTDSGAITNVATSSVPSTTTTTSTTSTSTSCTDDATPTPSSSSSSTTSTTSFALSNGHAAQALNAQFAALTPSSACSEGAIGCVGTQFAQCVQGSYVLTPCDSAGALICAALPLVNSPGTSVTCDTKADAIARIEATGATGGLTGSD